MPFGVSFINLTPSRRPAYKYMSLDCSLTVLRRTRFAGDHPCCPAVTVWMPLPGHFEDRLWRTPDGWVSMSDKFVKALFEPSYTL